MIIGVATVFRPGRETGAKKDYGAKVATPGWLPPSITLDSQNVLKATNFSLILLIPYGVIVDTIASDLMTNLLRSHLK